MVAGGAQPLLGQGDQVDVVLVVARRRQGGRQLVQQRGGVPARQMGGVAEAAGVRVERARGGYHRPVEVPAGQSRRLHRPVQGVGDLLDDGHGGAAGRGGQFVTADGAAGDVGDGRADPVRVHVQRGGVRGGRVHGVEPGARARAALRGAGGEDQPGRLQTGQELGGGRLGQAGELADPGTRQRAVLQQEVQGGTVVHGAQDARGARRAGCSCHAVRHLPSARNC